MPLAFLPCTPCSITLTPIPCIAHSLSILRKTNRHESLSVMTIMKVFLIAHHRERRNISNALTHSPTSCERKCLHRKQDGLTAANRRSKIRKYISGKEKNNLTETRSYENGKKYSRESRSQKYEVVKRFCSTKTNNILMQHCKVGYVLHPLSYKGNYQVSQTCIANASIASP